MKKYLTTFNASLQTALEYRAEGFIWFLTEIIPTLVILFFWYAAFRTRNNISGYTLSSMSAYYLGVIFVQVLATPHPEGSLSDDIKDGTLNFYLIKPLNIVWMRLFWEMAWKVIRLGFLLPTLMVILIILKSFNISFGEVTFFQIILFVFGLVLSFILQYLVKFTLALTSFWLLDPWGIFSLFDLVVSLFSGALLPLDLLPEPLQRIAQFLPFKFFYFSPLAILIGKLQGYDLYFSFLLANIWLVISLLCLIMMMRRGLKVYSAFGG